MKVRVKTKALTDLQAISDFGVAHWGIPRTDDFLSGLIETMEGLVQRPQGGRPRPTIAEGMRSIRHRGYLVFFVVEDGDPVVIGVVSERQDLAAIDFADRLEGE